MERQKHSGTTFEIIAFKSNKADINLFTGWNLSNGIAVQYLNTQKINKAAYKIPLSSISDFNNALNTFFIIHSHRKLLEKNNIFDVKYKNIEETNILQSIEFFQDNIESLSNIDYLKKIKKHELLKEDIILFFNIAYVALQEKFKNEIKNH